MSSSEITSSPFTAEAVVALVEDEHQAWSEALEYTRRTLLASSPLYEEDLARVKRFECAVNALGLLLGQIRCLGGRTDLQAQAEQLAHDEWRCWAAMRGGER